jgi:acyl-CoA thioester hydrolase
MTSVLYKNDYPLRHPLRVRWAEVDAQNIVFNAHYLAYFDIGITEYWRAIGLPYPDSIQGTEGDLFVVKSVINYHAPARYDDMIEICVHAGKVGNSSMTFAMAIYRADECLVTGELVYVFACPEERKSRPLPRRLRDAVAGFEAPR